MDDQDKNVEPPELRKQGITPLRKIVIYFSIGIAIAFVVVLIFSLIFKSHS